MLTSALEDAGLAGRLSAVRGRLAPGRKLAQLTWLRVGGPAEALLQPADADDLAAFLAACPGEVPVTPLGVGSNLIVRDGGLPGVVLRLGRGFNAVQVLEGGRVRAGAAALDAQVAKAAAAAGIAGFEFLRGVPGTVGGALRMNAGCYGSYVADLFERAVAVDRRGRRRELGPGDMGFGYRSSALPEDLVFVEATLKGWPDDPAAVEARMAALMARRAATQPVKARSAGSTFRNPAGYSSTGRADDSDERKAWKLIDDAGCRGATLGGAQMSPMHPNFLVNLGDATAADLETLGERVRRKVLETTGVELVWEVQRIGVNPAG